MRSHHHVVATVGLLFAAHLAACGGNEIVSPSRGAILVTTITTGADPDADGYTLQVDARTFVLAASTTIRVPDLAPGQHSISLVGIADNCQVSGSLPRTVMVQGNDTAEVEFSIACAAPAADPAPPPSHIAFAGFLGQAVDLYIMDADGSDLQSLGIPGGYSPSLSFDGGKLAYDLGGRLIIRSTAGGAEQEIPIDHFTGSPAWSRDGSKLALIAAGTQAVRPYEIWTVKSDGTGLRQITFLGGNKDSPSWSPDGTRLVLAHQDSLRSDYQLYLVNADGSDPHAITDLPNLGALNPDWSPDGSLIAFEAWSPDSGQVDIYVMPPIPGATPKRLTFDRAMHHDPSWSPDGSRLTFDSNRDKPATREFQIFSMKADGSDEVQLTHTVGFSGLLPSWSQ